MNKSEILDKQKDIFGKVQLLANKLKKFEDYGEEDKEMTIRQWLLTLAIAQFGDNSPTLSELGELMGSTHQNVKQLALKLEMKGFLRIEKDKQDLRVIRFKLTEKSYFHWRRIQARFKNLLTELFSDLSEEEINLLYDCVNKLNEGIGRKKQSIPERICH